MVALSNKDIPLRSSLLVNEPELLVLIEKYVNKYPSMIDEIKHAFEAGEWDHFEKKLHDIKSTGGNYGFMCITEQAIQIKMNYDKKDYTTVKLLLTTLKELHKQMLLGLEKK